MSRRSRCQSQFRYQTDFYGRYKEKIKEPILDVGCGDGGFLKLLCERGWRDLHGIDISDVGVDMARESLRPCLGEEVDSRIKRGNMISLTDYYPREYFNTVICEGTLHQSLYTGAEMTLRKIHEVTSGEGLIYLSVRSDATVPDNALPLEESETYRLPQEDGVVRCYFSRRGITSLLDDVFHILELEERELLTIIEERPYKMWILVLRNTSPSS